MELDKPVNLNPKYINNKDFYDSIKDLVTCTICLGVLINAQTCNTCENSFCSKCLLKWKNTHSSGIQNSCPMKCKNNQFNSANRVLKNLLDKLEFKCKYKCNEDRTFDYNGIIEHLSHKCDNIQVSCVVCSKKMKYTDYSKSVYYKEKIQLLDHIQVQNSKIVSLEKAVEKLKISNNENNTEKEKLLKEVSSLKSKLKNLQIDENYDSKGKSIPKRPKSGKMEKENEQYTPHPDSFKKSSTDKSKKTRFNQEKDKSNIVTIHDQKFELTDKCKHFMGNYIPIFDCCEKSYPCYLCHKEAVNHEIQISNKVICLICKEIYTGNQCTCCGAFQLYKRKDY